MDEVSLFDQLGGEAGLRRLVDAFYDRMETDARCAGIRAMHPPSLDGSRDKLFWFLCGWSGGPPHFEQRFGHPRLRARHLPFAIGVSERDQWLGCFRAALVALAVDGAVQAKALAAIEPLADWMRNQPG